LNRPPVPFPPPGTVSGGTRLKRGSLRAGGPFTSPFQTGAFLKLSDRPSACAT